MRYDNFMEKYKGIGGSSAQRIAELLDKMNSPRLTEKGKHAAAARLTDQMRGDARFLMTAFPKKQFADADMIRPDQLKKAHRIFDQNGQQFLPLYVREEDIAYFRKGLEKGECIYLCDKKDILDFLLLNNDAAAIINPVKNGLLVYPAELQNLIWTQEHLK